MTYRYPDFLAQAQNKYNAARWYSGRTAEWSILISAVAGDNRTHDKTIQNPSAALSVGAGQTWFENEISLLVNRGLAGNLTQSQMVSAMGSISGAAEPPGSISRATIFASASPPVVGTVLTVIPGTWAGAPTSRTYIWTRDGTTIAGATATTYTLVSADIGGHSIRSVESAVNASGTTVGPPSNHIQA